MHAAWSELEGVPDYGRRKKTEREKETDDTEEKNNIR